MHRLIFVLFALLTLSLHGCAERNNPVYSEVDTAIYLVSQTRTLGWAEDVWVYEDRAFVADGEQGVSIWNISDLSAPTFLDTIPRQRSDARQVAYAPESDMLIVVESGGLSVHELATKTRKFNLWDSGIEDVCFFESTSDTLVIGIVDWDEGFKVNKTFYNNARNRWEESELAGTHQFQFGTARGLYLDNTTAFIGNAQMGLVIADVYYHPLGEFPITEVSLMDTPGGAYDVYLNDEKTHLYIADMMCGLQVVDVTDINAPTIVGSVEPDEVDQAFMVTAVGDTAYFLDKYNGVYAADVSVPDDPILIGRYDTPSPNGFFVTNDHTIFLADEEMGLLVLSWRY